VLAAVTPRTNPHDYTDASVRIYAMNRIDGT